MSATNLVRPSRDGDQFHYLWAARRCLGLLAPDASLKAVTIEGSSPSETSEGVQTEAGEDLIDVAEYYGSENVDQATLIRYIQLKHSTLHADEPWPPSGLEKTLSGFAERYAALCERLGANTLAGKIEFCFVTNRPVDATLCETVREIADGVQVRKRDRVAKLEHFTNLSGGELAAFCKLLRLEANQDGLWDQRNRLLQDAASYLADADVDAPLQLKELITTKALSENAENPTITRADVLRALKTDESRLFPAPNLFTAPQNVIARHQEAELLRAIVRTAGAPIIVHAAAGVGKSVFATCIGAGLPPGSWSVLFDCFGNGQYRSASAYRHRHKDALVQIANELAAKGLCHPLVPSTHADSSAYVRAFLHRVRQSITSLKSKTPEALLCIVIDAADNAQMAAQEIGETRSFPLDLLREQLPEGVRLVALCRTHRVELLAPPPEALCLELQPFSRGETEACLRYVFPGATSHDVDEFHRLTSQNPRVQALALDRRLPLNETLRALGPNPTTVDDTIGKLLADSIARLRDVAGFVGQPQIDGICAGLAVLRPLIPLSVLASMSGFDEEAIRSFALDLGRPLLVAGDTIQFFDEPAETWFREKYRPKASALGSYVATLKPFAATSAYVASVLPQLMLEAGQIDELIALALSSDALPGSGPVEKRDVELQRLQFALKAALRAKRHTDAAKLALKAGGECAGDERQRKLLQRNTDLAAAFLGTSGVQELVSRRTFRTRWVGSHHAYESALLSERPELLGEARSRLRMAHEWLRNWLRLSPEERRDEPVTDEDILQLATAHYHIHGAEGSVRELHGWRPREVAFRVCRLLARRFIDHGRDLDLERLATAARNNLFLILALAVEMRTTHRTPPKVVVEHGLRLIRYAHVSLESGRWDDEGTTIDAVTALVEAAHKLSVGATSALVDLLRCYLPPVPPQNLGSRFNRARPALLRAYALRSALARQPLPLKDVASDNLQKELDGKGSHGGSRDLREFRETVGTLLPWHRLWASCFVDGVPPGGLDKAIAAAKAESDRAVDTSYREEEAQTLNQVAELWFEISLVAGIPDEAALSSFDRWKASLKTPPFTTTLAHLSRLSARTPNLNDRALEFAKQAFELTRDAREDADTRAETYLELARAIFVVSRSEAAEYFNQAVLVASKTGEENLTRWGALLDLADRAAQRDRPSPEAAYRLARCAELTYEYVVRDKHFDWGSTVEAISGLCASSSLAILSRWRDRDFGSAERLLPSAVEFLVDRGDLEPTTSVAMMGFRARWNEPSLLRSALLSKASESEKQVALNVVYRYMSLRQHRTDKWRELKGVVTEYGAAPADLDERIAQSVREDEAKDNGRSPSSQPDTADTDNCDWDAIFGTLDLCSPNDLAAAHQRFRDGGPYHRADFFREACARVQAGQESNFIKAFASVAKFDLYDLGHLINRIPDSWKARLALKPALAETLNGFCRRYCMSIRKDRYYGIFPWQAACALSGLTEKDVFASVLISIGEAPEIADADRLFTLVGLLALQLTHDEAQQALSFALDLFDSDLKDTDGDGPWSNKLEPPREIDASVAGYIWNCLASPEGSVRWEAAHAVRALCALNQERILEHLVAFARGASGAVFSDARLFFYELHAQQWLLIGLARAAKDHPNLVALHADYLMQAAFSGDPHVIRRQFAKRALLSLLEAGALPPDAALRSRLLAVNSTQLPVVESKSYRRPEGQAAIDGDSTVDEADRYYFGIDFGPYWLAPLGRCFAKSQAAVEREALRVIRVDWRIHGGHGWQEDERHRRGVFKNRDTYHSHGSWPRVEDQHFYFSYHAMMVAAGKLLATEPVHRDPEDPDDDFEQWLTRHDLRREDGAWVADRRDAVPLERPEWKDTKENPDWRWTLVTSDFDRILLGRSRRMNLWGRWTWIAGGRRESIHVSSAFVSPDRSTALLAALQSAENPHDYRIPEAEDDTELDADGFRLRGWIAVRDREGGLDEGDPWGGAIKYPPAAPAAYVTDLMNLEADGEQRSWRIRGDSAEALWSQTWGHFHDEADRDQEQETGFRLQASFPFLLALLGKLGMDLIIEIEIERRATYSRSETTRDNELGFIPANARIFLVRADGRLSAL